MRVLVLGNSDTEGLHAGGRSWTQLLPEKLAGGLDEPVEAREVSFYPVGPKAPSYAAKNVREYGADVVVIPLGTFAFTVGFVWKRVEALFGKRAGAWYRRLEEGFDAGTRKGGSIRQRFDLVLRKVVRRVVGTKPLSTKAEVTAGYQNVLRSLAQEEDVQVVLMTYPGRTKYTRRGKNPRLRREFLDEVGAVASEHHFEVVETDTAFDGRTGELNTISGDGYHLNQLGHEVMADVLAEAVRRVARPESAGAPAAS